MIADAGAAALLNQRDIVLLIESNYLVEFKNACPLQQCKATTVLVYNLTVIVLLVYFSIVSPIFVFVSIAARKLINNDMQSFSTLCQLMNIHGSHWREKHNTHIHTDAYIHIQYDK